MESVGEETLDENAETAADKSYVRKSNRFRFKHTSRLSSRPAENEDPNRLKRHRHYHSSHRHRKRRRGTELGGDDPSGYDDSSSQLPPDAAFRESLFDALGDDEGAAFWEGVYGQPIHTYPTTYREPETGELEKMDEEEYAQYVRRKMWEKSWEGIEAAKEEKRKQREREQERKKIRDEDKKRTESSKDKPPFGYIFDLEVEGSIKRGENRKERRRWGKLWEGYLQRWGTLQQLANDRNKAQNSSEKHFLRDQIAWPVETGKRKDLGSDEIERFIVKGSESTTSENGSDELLLNVVKSERVKWHPDKIQQRYGFMEIDEDTMAGVTAVFQALNRMWNDRRSKR